MAKDDWAAPRYVVEFQTTIDSYSATPAQAGVEGLKEMRSPDAAVIVTDVITGQQWDVRFRDHILDVIELKALDLTHG